MQKSGFTLIELLVTVAIVGILASVSVANFNEYRRKANDIAAISDLRNAATALQAYVADSLNAPADVCAINALNVVTGSCTAMLPGFKKSRGVSLYIQYGSTGGFNALAGHCMGTRFQPTGSYSDYTKIFKFTDAQVLGVAATNEQLQNQSYSGSSCP